jgi:hypothetical protein
MGLSSFVNICHSERLLNYRRTAPVEWVLQIDLTRVNHRAKNPLEPCAVLRQKDPSRGRAVAFGKIVPPFLVRKIQ